MATRKELMEGVGQRYRTSIRRASGRLAPSAPWCLSRQMGVRVKECGAVAWVRQTTSGVYELQPSSSGCLTKRRPPLRETGSANIGKDSVVMACTRRSFLASSDMRCPRVVLRMVLAVTLSLPLFVASGAEKIPEVPAGSEYTCAVVVAGGVKCWGANSSGQLGDGSSVNRNTPVDVSGLTEGAAAIAAGSEHTCALATGGAMACWGANSSGQLGDGTSVNRTTPVNVPGLPSVRPSVRVRIL